MADNENPSGADAFDQWDPEDKELEVLLSLTERSLKEVKGLTEYEDQKAQRVLAAVAFLSALGGGIFAISIRVLPAPMTNFGSFLVYALFALFAFFVGAGAVLVLMAIRPRFNVPMTWSGSQGDKKPKSYLFFEKIIELDKTQWQNAFVKNSAKELQLQYVKNSIHETYLVSQKIRDKMKWLQPGVISLLIGILILSIWMLVTVVTIGSVSSFDQGRLNDRLGTKRDGVIPFENKGSVVINTCGCPCEASAEPASDACRE